MRRGQNADPQAGVAPAGEEAAQDAARGLDADTLSAMFGAAFEESGEGLAVVDHEFRILKANSRGYDILRVDPAANGDAGAPRLSEILPQSVLEEVEKAARAKNGTQAGSHVDATLAAGFAVRIRPRFTSKDARFRLLHIEEGSVVQRCEAKWRQSESEISAILDSVRVGILLLDAEGNVRHANARFGQLFGLDASNLKAIETAQDLKAFLAPQFESPAEFVEPWNRFANGEGTPSHDELEIVRPSRRALERFARPVLGAGNAKIGWLEVYYDVSGERQLQAKLLQTEKMAALGQLVSGIAHKLNNPLTAIMGYAQLLLSHGLKPEQYAEARKVFEEAERATRIVKNLLYFARENKPERKRVAVNEIVERALALRSYELKLQNIVVECVLAPNLPEVLVDQHQLQQAVLNLLVNAEQALLHSRGQGRIWLRTRHAAADRVALEISDDGPGIPKEIAAQVFEPFFTTKPPGLGTGLGLSIVYGILKQHDGEITLENRSKGGATFVLELPAAPKAEIDAPVVHPLTAELPLAAPPSRILVVEDEPSVAQLVVDVLREEGHLVEAVLESQDGLNRLSRGEYDLVICDLRMPRLDGPAFHDALVRSGSPLQDRIIFITGDTLGPRTARYLEETGLPCLAKPFLIEELRLAVNRRLADGTEPGPVAGNAKTAEKSKSRQTTRRN